MTSRLALGIGLAALVATVLAASPRQSGPFFPLDEVRPGLEGVGRTVFTGDTLEEFRVTVIGVLRNAVGVRRNLILARLDGGPLATTGVIQGMSGSPVYVDGRLLGAVSYSLGSFPKEPLAGITPIQEMIEAVGSTAPRSADSALAVDWSTVSAKEIFAALGAVSRRAFSSFGVSGGVEVVGPRSLADLVPALRPIGAAMVLGGFEPGVGQDLRSALAPASSVEQALAQDALPSKDSVLSPGDAVGMSLIHGDLLMGATGTVTYVDGARVYAFGHPFLSLGPTSFPMTKATVHTVLPSLDLSTKISSLGPIIGTMSQDRTTGVGGTLGPGPDTLEVRVTLASERAPTRRFSFSVVRDQALTPLFTYVAVLNAITTYERQAGAMTVAARGTVSFGADGEVAIDDLFSGDGASQGAAQAVAAPVGAAMTNEFRVVVPDRVDVELHASERREGTTIDRVWFDTVRPRFGATHTLQVQLRDYRGGTRLVSMPIAMPSYASGPLTLVVTDAAGLTALEQSDLRPGQASNWAELLTELNATRRNNRLYARLLASSPGTVVGGDTLPGLPSSVRSVLDADTTIARAPVTRTVVGAWEERLDTPVSGSRELTFTLTPRP